MLSKLTTAFCLVCVPLLAQNAGVALSLTGAIERARIYSPQFLSAEIASLSAREDRIQSKSNLLPSVNYFNQYVYTQGNGTPTGIFVGNNGVHFYTSTGTVHEELSLTHRADYRRSIAAEVAARARQDIARRGLSATVAQAYYAMLNAQRHATNAKTSLDESRQFADITRKQERGGEAARSDVVKAELVVQQHERDYLEAQLVVEKTRVGLSILLFPDLNRDFTILDDLLNLEPLGQFEDLRTLAVSTSPEIRAADATIQQARFGIDSARSGYIPSLVIDYFYGLSANQFAVHNPDGANNLGNSVLGTLNIPIWNWGATRSRVRQAELQRRQAEIDRLYTGRQLQAALDTSYLEAQSARTQLDSLKASLDLAVESRRLTLLRYEAGEVTVLEVVDAQNTLSLARNAYDDGLVRYRLALASLQTLTGTL